MQMAVPLLIVNLFLLLWIGLIRHQNPFDIWVLLVLVVGNGLILAAAAIVGHDSPATALTHLITNLLPFLVLIGGAALLLVVLTVGGGKKKSGH